MASLYSKVVGDLLQLMGKNDDKMTSAWTVAKLWRGISAKRQEAIYDFVLDEHKESLISSLTATVREQVEQELREKWKADAIVSAKESVRMELESAKPTQREREAFQTFVQETEVDTLAQATVASASGDRLTRKLSWSRRLRGMLAGGLFLGLWPALYGVFHFLGTLLAPELGATLVGFLVTLLLVLRSNRKHYATLEAEIKRLYKTASDYLVLAERAKSFRIVHVERLDTKKRIDELTATLRDHKNKLDNDFHPSVRDLDGARESVRQRVMADQSVSLRISEDDFEERLKEAQAEAEAVEAAVSAVQGR